MTNYKMPQLFRILGIILAFSAVLPFSTDTAVFAAPPYPSKAVRLIVPYAAGGSVDIIARLLSTKLSERLGKQVIVDNHGGASSIIGTEMVAKADPDGYTLLIATTAHGILPALQKLPYDPVRSFSLIARVGTGPNALVIHPNIPAKSVKELIALAKQKPGQLTFAGTGSGSSAHLGAELFMKMADINCKIVQFKSAGSALIAQARTTTTTCHTRLPASLRSAKMVLPTGPPDDSARRSESATTRSRPRY